MAGSLVYTSLLVLGVRFSEASRREAYGRVVVSLDHWANRWDLIEARQESTA